MDFTATYIDNNGKLAECMNTYKEDMDFCSLQLYKSVGLFFHQCRFLDCTELFGIIAPAQMHSHPCPSAFMVHFLPHLCFFVVFCRARWRRQGTKPRELLPEFRWTTASWIIPESPPQFLDYFAWPNIYITKKGKERKRLRPIVEKQVTRGYRLPPPNTHKLTQD